MNNTKLTNVTNIPLSLAVWLAYDNYDYNSDPNTISVTTLLKPIKEIVLARQNNQQQKEGDISSLVSSGMGQALHTAIESVWEKKERVVNSLIRLGYPESVANKILINPSKEELYDGCIPVYMEQRVDKQVGKYKVSGKLDFTIEGRLEDFKSTGTYTYMKQSNTEKFKIQGSMYRWLNPEIITEDIMAIQYLFTDWSKLESIKNKSYPQQRLLEQKITLWSIDETDRWVKNRLALIDQYQNATQDQIPECTEQDLWIDPPVWKYYKDPNKTTRSTKNFDKEHEAYDRLHTDGSVGIVKKVESKVKKCKYCSVQSLCDQAKGYIESGRLTL